MDWTAPVDAYCERLSAGWLAEPLNLASNLGFVLAGVWLIWRLRDHPPGLLPALSWLLVLIGLGSASFHSLAQRWTGLLDVLFIAAFILLYVVAYLRHRWHCGWLQAWLGIPGFLALAWLCSRLVAPEALNGSAGYLPALVGLLLMGLATGLREGWQQAGGFLIAAAVFTASLALRSADLALCERWSTGTHWAWHLLNALTLLIAVHSLTRPAGREAAR